MYYKKQIFIEWKYEYVTTKKLCHAIEKVYRRKFLKEPCRLAMDVIKGRINRAKAQDMIIEMFDRKSNQLRINALSMWRVNVEKTKQSEIKKRLDNLDAYEAEMKEVIRDRAFLISQ